MVRALGFSTNGIDWWDEINGSDEWQRSLFYALCAAYSLVSLVALRFPIKMELAMKQYFIKVLRPADITLFCLMPTTWLRELSLPSSNFFGLFSRCRYLVEGIITAILQLFRIILKVQLIRIQLRVPEYGWTTQKLFHLLNFLVNGLRAVLFGFYHNVFLLRPKVLEMALLDFPGLLFFSTYTLLVLFWAEIYHQARSLPINKLRPSYLIINVAVYAIQICIWIYVRVSSEPIAVEITKLFLAVVSFFAALGFLIYGGRLFIMLRRFPIESKGRRKKLNEVGFVTGICCTCFLIRCIVVALSAFDENADVDVLYHPLLNFIFYLFTEILPSALVLFILRKLPPKRVSDQYHPIN